MISPLTNRLTGLYANTNLPHCKFGLGSSIHLAHNRAPSGFFVRAIQIFCVMAGLNGETFGSVGSKCLSANPIQSCHHLLGSFGDGLKNLHLESVIMQKLTTNPSVIRPFALVCSFRVPTSDLSPGFTPSITLVIGHYHTQQEVKQARQAIQSPALISAWMYQSFVDGEGV
jgi:hypothetical protein